MARRSVLVAAVAVALVGSIAVGMPAATGRAQEATPAASGSVVPDPAECTVEPRSIDSVRAVLGAADSGTERPGAAEPGTDDAEPADPELGEPIDPELGGPPPVPVGVALPAGEPADEATVAAVTATARQFLACLNAGDVPRMYALVSDEFLRQSFAGQPPTEAVLAYFTAPPTPRPVETRASFLGLRQARVLPDGRVGALVDDRDPTVPGVPPVSTDFVVFAEAGDRWVMDQLIAGLERTHGPEATPAP